MTKHVKTNHSKKHFTGTNQGRRLIVTCLVAMFSLATVYASALTTKVTPVNPVIPVIFVHGYSSATPQGLNTAGYWSAARNMLASQGFPLTDTLTVSYYKNDTNGVDITGSGPGTTYPNVVTAGHTRAGYNHTDGIEPIAHDLAWFIYNQYGSQSVDLVGHSMGGLIMRYALQQVQAANPSFPPSLNIHLAVTLSSPFGGLVLGCKDTQCNEMLPGSSFLAALDANTPSITQWVAIGGNGQTFGHYCDEVTPDSATDIAGIQILYTYPCYQHMGYLSDTSKQLVAKGIGPIDGRRSLYELSWLLTQSSYGM